MQLTHHRNTHRGQTPRRQCPWCENTYTRWEDYNSHKRRCISRPGYQRLPCGVCDLDLSREDSRIRHRSDGSCGSFVYGNPQGSSLLQELSELRVMGFYRREQILSIKGTLPSRSFDTNRRRLKDARGGLGALILRLPPLSLGLEHLILPSPPPPP